MDGEQHQYFGSNSVSSDILVFNHLFYAYGDILSPPLRGNVITNNTHEMQGTFSRQPVSWDQNYSSGWWNLSQWLKVEEAKIVLRNLHQHRFYRFTVWTIPIYSIGVATSQSFWIYACINPSLLQLLHSRMLRDFFVSSPKSKNLLLGVGLVAFALVVGLLLCCHIPSTFSQTVDVPESYYLSLTKL